MTHKLDALEPKNMFHYFEVISSIPRGSGDEKAISDYMVTFAKELGLWVKQDEVYNIYIKKPATPGYEHLPTVILQGHLDMVCEKNKDTQHDFEKDGLDLYIDGDFIKAKGTTLGADNGIAIAYQMAILADNTLKHPAIEAFMTTSEETGMFGVAGMHPEHLEGKVLLNLDTDIEGEFLVSCAGGIRAYMDLPIQREVQKEGKCYTLMVNKLLGGHSGGDIHLERANATLSLARVLAYLGEHIDLKLCQIAGGSKDNVIPREAEAVICTTADETELKDLVATMQDVLTNEYSAQDPDITLSFVPCHETMMPMNEESTNKVFDFLKLLPNGVVSYSRHIDGLVETSLNLGVVETKEGILHCTSAIRSSVPTKKEAVVTKLVALSKTFGATFTTAGDYPAWEYANESPIRELAAKIYKEVYNKEPDIKAIHAGLECGFITEKMPELDIIAFGPNTYDIHSPNERASISSMQRVYAYLVTLLEKMTEY